MNQTVVKESRITKVMEGIRMFFSALSVNENITQAPEEEVKQSGIKELLNSSERIKNMESIFEEKGTSIKQVKTKLKNEELNRAPRIRNSIINVNIQEAQKDEDLER